MPCQSATEARSAATLADLMFYRIVGGAAALQRMQDWQTWPAKKATERIFHRPAA